MKIKNTSKTVIGIGGFGTIMPDATVDVPNEALTPGLIALANLGQISIEMTEEKKEKEKPADEAPAPKATKRVVREEPIPAQDEEPVAEEEPKVEEVPKAEEKPKTTRKTSSKKSTKVETE